jgi:hypothetical protein
MDSVRCTSVAESARCACRASCVGARRHIDVHACDPSTGPAARGGLTLRPSESNLATWRRARAYRTRIWHPSTALVVLIGGFLLLRFPAWVEPPGEAFRWVGVQVAALIAAAALFALTEYRVGGTVTIDPAAHTLTWKRHFTGAVRGTWRFDEIESIEGCPWYAGSELRIVVPARAFCLPLRHPRADVLADSIRAATPDDASR